MARLVFKRHRFPGEVIRHAVWLYFRFTLSLRDVEELMAQRGVEVSYEAIRCWTLKFGRQIARNLNRRKLPASPRWHLDEMVSTIGGERMYIWRAVDDEGEVLDLVVQKRRDTAAALRFLRRLIRNQGRPETVTTDGLKSYGAAFGKLDPRHTASCGPHPGEQSGREFAPADPTTRAQDAGLQVARLRAVILHHSSGDLQRLRASAPPDQQADSAHLAGEVCPSMGGGGCLKRPVTATAAPGR